MKQRLTASQLQQLSEGQVEQLRSLWTPQEGDYIYTSGQEEMVYYLNGFVKTKSLPLFSIGQLLELLHERQPSIRVQAVNGEWRAATSRYEWTASELCDALWEALKQELNVDGMEPQTECV
ncbi:hypothetical protein [Paenibacillus silviterrae]|uniref:hypothetical protein n=1 Tax=Paenibacillus silviterrae TaxID=3242194 RepID=UPI002542831F|nr:hypothetical protein [Paenibacillus chinjuensis]